MEIKRKIKCDQKSDRVKGYAIDNLDFLKRLHHCKKRLRACDLKSCNKYQILSLCECIDNVLGGNLVVSQRRKRKLGRHKVVLRKLRDPAINWRMKQTVVQTGKGLGAVAAILSTVVPFLIDLIKGRL